MEIELSEHQKFELELLSRQVKELPLEDVKALAIQSYLYVLRKDALWRSLNQQPLPPFQIPSID
jgi:hypothetical protein